MSKYNILNKMENIYILTYIYILVLRTSKGKQTVTEITLARLLLRNLTLADTLLGTGSSSLTMGLEALLLI